MKYDTTLKELLQAGAPLLWEVLAQEQPEEFLTVELPSVQMRKPDFVARLASGALFHLELQGDNDLKMEWRELEYYLLLYKLFDQAPIQFVLYFGSAPMAMRSRIGNESLQFRFTLLDIRQLKSEYFLEGGSLSDALLAVLARAENLSPREVIEKVAEKLRPLPTKEQRDWMEKLMIISGIRGYEDIVRKEAEKMGISLDIRDNKFFQEAYAVGVEDGLKQGIGQGIEQGVERGIEEGEAAFLMRMLERRFGPLPEWARERIEKMDRAALEEAGLRLLDAAKLEDVFPQQPSN